MSISIVEHEELALFFVGISPRLINLIHLSWNNRCDHIELYNPDLINKYVYNNYQKTSCQGGI